MATSYFRYDTWVKTAQGPAVAGAQIWVCTQPANVNSVPPSPLASIFSDPNGLVPITQPISTDGLGHADFYAQAGLYTVIVAYNGIIQEVYPDQSLGGIGSGGGGSITFQTNGVNNANQFLVNIQNTDGALSISSDGSGDVTINNPAIPSGGSSGQVLSKSSNTSFATAWTTPQSGASFSTAGTGFFWGAGIVTPLSLLTLAGAGNDLTPTGGSQANIVIVWQFSLLAQWTLRNCYYTTFNSNGSNTVDFGIYNLAGGKLVDAGGFSCSSAVEGTLQSNAFSAVTLPPGTYYFAQTYSYVGGGWDGAAGPISPDIGAGMIPVLNAAAVPQLAQATNLASGGLLPATLGALTPLSSTGLGIGMPLWTP